VVSIAGTTLYFSQSQELRKEFLTLAVTIIKYIMLFKPQLNTKKAFAKKRLEQVENDG